MRYNNIKGSAILCCASLLWGLGFVAQSEAAEKIPSFLFGGLRSLIAAVFLFAFLLLKKAVTHRPVFCAGAEGRRLMLKGGLICGVVLMVSINLQNSGIVAYPAGVASEARAGFITALYVVLVPLGSIFVGRRISPLIWLAVVVAMGGILLLCMKNGIGGIYLGDLLVFLCAFTFAVHIFAVDHFVEQVGGILLSALQFLVCGLLSVAVSVCVEEIRWSDIVAAAPQILYMGIVSSGIAYTLQNIGQRYAEPAPASLSMSLESVFAALGGWLISHKTLLPREIAGCALVFIAIILAQLPQLLADRRSKKAAKAS